MSHVAIVGAGPAGACLAHVLAKRGVEVTLLERQRDFEREFRGEILMPSGVEALKQAGLGEVLSATPSHHLRDLEIFLNGKLRLRQSIAAASPDGAGFLAVSQSALLESLVGETGKSPSFRLERGATVKGLLVEDGRVVGVQAAIDDDDRDIRADLVVAADGRSSAVRRHAGLKPHHTNPLMDVVWCKLPCPSGWNGVRAFAGRGHLLVAYHTWDGSLQLGWIILKGTFGDLRSRGIEQWVEEMARHVSPDLAEHLRSNLDAVHKPFLLSTTSDCVEHWSKPGVLLIGDAAHTMSPVGGQGVNIALRDAIVAANHFVPVMTRSDPKPEDIDAAATAIETERMVEIRKIQAMQAGPPKLILSRAWWGEPLRRFAGALLSSSFVRGRAGSQASAFLHGVTKVSLSV